MTWTCFLIEPNGHARRSLRRYADGACAASGTGYHNAQTAIGTEPCAMVGDIWRFAPDPAVPHDDPRWPTHCACGYVFGESDEWQVFDDPLYLDAATGQEYPLREAPTGALWDAVWLHTVHRYHERSPDGRVLVLRLPDGYEWVIDGLSSNGPGWTRSGTPPVITARPSILSPGYHGFLDDGVLSDDLEGREYWGKR